MAKDEKTTTLDSLAIIGWFAAFVAMGYVGFYILDMREGYAVGVMSVVAGFTTAGIIKWVGKNMGEKQRK